MPEIVGLSYAALLALFAAAWTARLNGWWDFGPKEDGGDP